MMHTVSALARRRSSLGSANVRGAASRTTPFEVLRPAQVRSANATAVLRLLLAAGPLPRAEIARRLGLTHGPVTRIVAQLAAAGYLHELDRVGSGNPGRPRVPVALSPRAGHVMGVHIGAYEVTAGSVDLTGRVVDHVRIHHDVTPAGAVDVVARAVSRLSSAVGTPLLGVGVITAGWVEARSGLVRSQPLLGWSDVPLRRLVEEAVGVPVALEQTARALATADLVHDLVGGARDFLHVFVGNALEAALVVDGRVRTAEDGFGGDLSRWVLDAGGGRTTTAATAVSDAGLVEQAAQRGVPVTTGRLDELLAHRDHPVHGSEVRAVLAGGALSLGHLLAAASDLLGPGLIVVTSQLGVFDADFHLVERGLRERADGRHAPEVRPSTSAGHPTVSPAAAVLLEQLLDDPIVVTGP